MTQNELFLYGTVGQGWWDEAFFTSSTVREQLAQMSGDIVVHINSGGGDAFEGQAIYTLLRDHKGKVTCVVDGVAMSAASLIFMAGEERVMRAGSLLLIHDPATYGTDGRGTQDDHERTAATLEVIANTYAEIYATRAGLSAEEARAVMKAETMLDGTMAVSMGFATAVDADATPAVAATFDYRIYANAPRDLRDASRSFGEIPGKSAVMAMMAGQPRKKEETTMTDTTVETATEVDPVVAEETTETAEGETTPAVTARADTVRERTRARRILDAVSMAGLPVSMAQEMITAGTSEAAALDAIFKKRKENAEMDTTQPVRPAAVVTADARDKFVTGATLAVMAKIGLTGERNEFSSLTLSELARESILMAGERPQFADRRDMVGRAFTMAGSHTTSDFGNILANVMGKSALKGWEEAPETYPLWTRKGTLTDFKQTKRVGAGVFGALPAIAEDGEYTYGTIGDRGENITLATYGKLLRITRQAIINDDLSILGDLPRKMGRAARRTIGNLVYAVLTGNPTMSDSVALFHATHANLAGTGTVLSVASLSAAKAAMRVQADAGSALNIQPKYLIVPAALELVAAQLLQSAYDPSANKGMVSNPVAGMAELVVDARLDSASAISWYMTADPNAFDTIEVAFLDGNDAPYLEQMNSWSADGVEMKVRIDAAAAPLDFRTFYKNPGA